MNDVAWVEAAAIGPEASHATWALAARMHLEDRAATYHGVVRLGELADAVQERTKIRTRAAAGSWLPDVLWRTMQENADKGEPFLAALAVDETGRVPAAYAGCVEHLRGGTVTDPDRQAAEERLDCSRWFGATLPEGGGEPGPLPLQAVRRAPAPRAASAAPRRTSAGAAAPRSTRVAKTDIVPKICPRCFMALPASGVCDTCD